MKQNQQLIDACNLLCKYVSENLPEGWMIELQMMQDDCDVTLYDPQGNVIQDQIGDGDYSVFAEMCAYAKEHPETE